MVKDDYRYEFSHIGYAKSPNYNVSPDLGWSVYVYVYDKNDQHVGSRIYGIDIEGATSNMNQWLKEQK